MIRLRAEIAPGGGALASPVSNARSTWAARRGLVLRLIDENGTVGQGEASPLPDFSADDLDSTGAALRALAESSLKFDFEQPLSVLLVEVGRLFPPVQRAARFAFETALFDLLGQRRHEPLWQLLASVPGAAERAPARLPLSALVDTTSEARAFQDAEAAIERGIGTLKLKLGRPGQAARELRIALALRAALGPKVRLRFDANRAWTPGEARITLQQLAQADPEFVEEAVEPAALVAAGRLPAPLALDESLLDADLLDRRGPELVRAGVTAVVLKPMLLGGFGACLRISARARELGLRVVASHLFDGPIALAATAALGLAAASADCASGLDRHAGLECWPRTPLPMIARSEVLPSDAPGLGLPLLAGSP